MIDKLALGQICFPKYFALTLSVSFHQCPLLTLHSQTPDAAYSWAINSTVKCNTSQCGAGYSNRSTSAVLHNGSWNPNRADDVGGQTIAVDSRKQLNKFCSRFLYISVNTSQPNLGDKWNFFFISDKKW